MSNNKTTTTSEVVEKQVSELIKSQVDELTNYCSLGNLKYDILPITAIDREFLQRLLDIWEIERASKYIASYYNGFRDIDAFVFVELTAIKKVLKKHKNRKLDKSELNYFLAKIEKYESEGKKYLMINGQHRTDVWKRFWNGDIPIHERFPQVYDKDSDSYITPIAGSEWEELPETQQGILLAQKHTCVWVNRFESLDNLKDLVVFHNDGNAWNPHEKRIISPSFLARKLYKLNEDKDFIRIHQSVGSHLPYSQAKKGIALFLSQMFHSYLNSHDSTEWFEIPNIQDTRLDDLVSIESDMYTKSKLTDFITLAKSIARGYAYWVDNKGKRGTVKHSIAMFRKYFVFRIVLDQKTHVLSKGKYKVNNEIDFVSTWAQQETTRMLEYNNISTEGRKEWNKDKKSGKLDGKQIKKLFEMYKKPKSYRWVSRGSSTGVDLVQVVNHQLTDFIEGYSGYDSIGCVSKHNTDSSTTMDNYLIGEAISETPLGEMIGDQWAKFTDGSQTHIGHKTSRANDGSYTKDNLELEDAHYNQSHGKENV
jgi:hypothetical protein